MDTKKTLDKAVEKQKNKIKKKILRAVMPLIIQFIGIVLICLLLLGSFIFIINYINSIQKSLFNIEGTYSNIPAIAKQVAKQAVTLTSDGNYIINDNYIEQQLTALKESQNDPARLGLITYEDNDEAEDAEEEKNSNGRKIKDNRLKKYVIADVISMFPKIQSNGDFDGIVKIKRSNISNDLTYIPYKKLKNKIKNAQSSKSKKKKRKVLQYYSLDPDTFNICYAMLDKDYNLKEESKDYQILIGGYTMPTNYLIATQLIVHNKKFMNQLMKLQTEKASITLTIDNETGEVQTTNIDTWIVKKKNGETSLSNVNRIINLINKFEYVKDILVKSSQNYFNVLDADERTQNIEQVMRYVLYKLTGTDYGETNLDNIIKLFEFSNVGLYGSGLSLTTPTLSKSEFVAALQAYGPNASASFRSNFLPYAAQIYDWSVQAGVNPELVIITAKGEGNFSQAGGAYNYWGIAVPNGASSGRGFGSLQAGIQGYASVIKSYQTGSKATVINQRAQERKAAGVDPLGYGTPDTLSGMQSIYSSLGQHVYGSSGKGGYYYMDPARAGVTEIYKTHAEFLAKCYNHSGNAASGHGSGTPVTVWEAGQYTAWQVKKKLEVWKQIFGNYGNITTSSGNSNIIEIAKTKLGCPYVLGAKGPDKFDCSGFVYWVFGQIGVAVPGDTNSYKSYAGSSKEISFNQMQPGDILVVFNTERGTTYGHAGIYLGNDQYIHAPNSNDVVKISTGANSKFKHVFRFN